MYIQCLQGVMSAKGQVPGLSLLVNVQLSNRLEKKGWIATSSLGICVHSYYYVEGQIRNASHFRYLYIT